MIKIWLCHDKKKNLAGRRLGQKNVLGVTQSPRRSLKGRCHPLQWIQGGARNVLIFGIRTVLEHKLYHLMNVLHKYL